MSRITTLDGETLIYFMHSIICIKIDGRAEFITSYFEKLWSYFGKVGSYFEISYANKT